MNMNKHTNKEINELRKEVKEQTGYNLKQIDIISFSADDIVYTIYKDYENDRRTGKKPIDSGRITRKDDKKMSRNLQRLNMNMPADLMQQVDEYANRMNLNRTSAMILLVNTALEQKNAMSVMEELLNKLTELEKARAK